MIQSEYNDLYEGDVAAVNVVYQSADLDPLVDEYQGILRSMEDLIDSYASQLQREKDVKRQTVSPMSSGQGSKSKLILPFFVTAFIWLSSNSSSSSPTWGKSRYFMNRMNSVNSLLGLG